MESPSFPEMVAALRAGDAGAVEALLRRFEPYLRRVVRLRLHDSRLARLFDSLDICQSILASFFAHAAAGQFTLASPEQLRGLLVRMALNKLASHARALGLEVSNLPGGYDAAGAGPSPLDLLADADLARAALGRLSPEERSLFRLNHVERRTWDDIARERGESADALRMRLTRALARVRRQLASEA